MSDYFLVKIRFEGDRQFKFVGPYGSVVSRLKIHASHWTERWRAIDDADFLLENNEQVEAVRVINEDGKLIYKAGAALAPKEEFPFHEYKYLRSIRNNRGTFEVKDEDGRWDHVTSDIYNECHAEAKRAGIRTDSFTVRGSICSIQTSGLVFSQQMNKWTGDED